MEVGEVVGVSDFKDNFDVLELRSPSLVKQSSLRVSNRIEQCTSLIFLSETCFLWWAPTDGILAEQN